MDKSLTVLLVEDDPEECRSFVQYVESTDDVQLVGVVNNADKALEYVKDFLPDAIILDLELHKGGGNGISFLVALGKEQSRVSPYILVSTNNISRTTHEQVRQLGADFIMTKSQSDYSAENVIEFLRSLKRIIHDSQKKQQASSKAPNIMSPNEIKKRLTSRIATEIDLIGISPKVIGRGYLIDHIMLLIEGQPDPVVIIAEKHGKTDVSVERAMQNAINHAWRSGDIDDLQRLYTARIVSGKGVPTLNEFVYYYSNKIKAEY